MTVRRIMIGAVAALTLTGAAHASELKPLQGRLIHLGELSGIAYYTAEQDGFRVVATLAEGETGAPVRLEAVLAPGQSVVLSTVRVVDGAPVPAALEISRQGDEVLVLDAPATKTSWDEVAVLEVSATH
jgi:hypothetical protein